jgi:hypothetical protein
MALNNERKSGGIFFDLEKALSKTELAACFMLVSLTRKI